MSGQELAVVDSNEIESQFPVLALDPAELQADLEETLGGEEISVASVDKVKVPTGGGKVYTLPGIGDEEAEAPVIQGVMLFGHYARLYWATKFGEGESGAPPNCSSPDGRIGIGDYGYGSANNPTGECAKCPMSQWVALNPKKPEKKTQRCAQTAFVYLLMPGLRFPVQLKLPRTSLNLKDNQGYRAYLRGLANRGLKPYQVVTEIGLRQEKNDGGIAYSIATFKVAGALSEVEAARARAYAEAVRPFLVPSGPAATEDGVVDAAPSETPSQAAPAANTAF